MKIGILGESSLAKSLGKKLIDAGVQVVFGVRPDFDTEEIEWKMMNRVYHRICPYESAIIQSDFVLICAENGYLPEIWVALKNTDTEDKIIIDCTNAGFEKKLRTSNTQLIKKAAPKAFTFKAFNNLGLDYPKNDTFGVIKETYFCGEDVPERLRVKRLIELAGFNAIDAGEMSNATLLEAFYHLRTKISWNQNEAQNYHFKLVSI
ncbi:NADPH-dependent F420 reductase [Algoriphagus vanfongensis]|uniref:NADPH-dependent F420 reductase n=1 Tax=Algoriphagus vanfongensis TaxID=426371 RepID=UPI0003FFAAEE|nr:NAD(P)-binding domain-containing protein [Algoriphagus vanfongensis]